MKLTREEWDKLSREEKREALIRFEEPDSLYQKETYVKLTEEKI